MPTYHRKSNFFDTDEGIAALQALKAMVNDASYATESSYSANTALHPDNLISFTDKHMCYLRDHPATNTQQYISNLRLMTKVSGGGTSH